MPNFIQKLLPRVFAKYKQQVIETNFEIKDEELVLSLPKPLYPYIIIDCSQMAFVDTFAVKTLYQVFI